MLESRSEPTDFDIHVRDIADHVVQIVDHREGCHTFLVHKFQGVFERLVTTGNPLSSARFHPRLALNLLLT